AEAALAEYLESVGYRDDGLFTQNTATEIVRQFIRITPPESPSIGLITMQYGGTRARSTKPGNVVLNMRTLLSDVAEVVMLSATAVSVPWTRSFVALRIWNKLWSRLNVDITEREAVLLYTMWKHRDHNNLIAEEGLLALVNPELFNKSRSSMSE